MQKEQIIKFVLAGILLILLFFVGTGYTTTNYNNTSYINGTLDANDKINKTGDTIGNSFRLDTIDGNGYIATTTNSNIIGYNIGSLSTLRRSEYRGYPGYAQIYLRSGITTTRTYNFSLDGVDLDSKNISNCGNCVNKSEAQYNNDMNAKLNTSGGNLTGIVNMTGIFPTRASLMDGKGMFMAYNDSIMRTQLSGNGVQEWKLFGVGVDAGYILYTTPGSPSSVGILFRNSTQDRRTQIWLAPDGLELYSSKNTSGTTGLKILNQDNGSTIKIEALAGLGDAIMHIDSTGKVLKGNTFSGSGNVYICWNFTTNSSYNGNPTC